MAAFREARRQAPGVRWLVRSGNAFGSKGTSLLGEGQEPSARRTHTIVSQLIEDPLLIDGSKAQLRVYAVVETVQPELRAHLHQRWFQVYLAERAHSGGSGTDARGIFHGNSGSRMVPPQDLVAAAEARAGRPWTHIWTQIEALVRTTIVAALRQAKREGERQARDTNDGAGKSFVLSCEHSIVVFDLILAGAGTAETTSGARNVMARAGQVDAHTGSGAGTDARLPRPLRPHLIEASPDSGGFYVGNHSSHTPPLTGTFSRDLLSWLAARAGAPP